MIFSLLPLSISARHQSEHDVILRHGIPREQCVEWEQ